MSRTVAARKDADVTVTRAEWETAKWIRRGLWLLSAVLLAVLFLCGS